MLSPRVLLRCSLLAILATAPVTALADVVLHPGDHYSFGDADGGSTRIGRVGALGEYLGDGLGLLADGDADFDLPARRVRAELHKVIGLGGNFEARSTIRFDFTVSDTANLRHRIGAWIAYEADWEGVVWNGISLLSNASVSVRLVLTDVSGGRNLADVLLYERDAATFKVKFVKVGNPLEAQQSGGAVGAVPAILIRGNTYRVTLILTCQIFAPETNNPVAIASDYMAGLFDQGDGGATLDRLAVKLAGDDIEIREKLEQFERHTHPYLTGRGEGHNNTETETGPPILNAGDATGGMIRDLDARRERGDAVVRWAVDGPLEIEGFHVYRSAAQEGPFERLTGDPIPAGAPMEYRDQGVHPHAALWYRVGVVGWTRETYSAAVALQDRRAASQSLALYHPNPLASKAEITFTLPGASEVELRLFDVHGRVVRELARGVFEPGVHAVPWEATDPRGTRLSAGVYFLRLQTRGATLSRKVTLLD